MQFRRGVLKTNFYFSLFFQAKWKKPWQCSKPTKQIKGSTRKYIFLFVFCKHLKQEGTTSKKKLNKNYKKIEKLSKTEQKLQKNIHTIYLFLLKTTLIKKNVTLQLYTHTRLLVKKRLLYLNSFELAFFSLPISYLSP